MLGCEQRWASTLANRLNARHQSNTLYRGPRKRRIIALRQLLQARLGAKCTWSPKWSFFSLYTVMLPGLATRGISRHCTVMLPGHQGVSRHNTVLLPGHQCVSRHSTVLLPGHQGNEQTLYCNVTWPPRGEQTFYCTACYMATSVWADIVLYCYLATSVWADILLYSYLATSVWADIELYWYLAISGLSWHSTALLPGHQWGEQT